MEDEDRLFFKNKKHMESCSTVKQYARRMSSKSSGIHINEPLASEHSLPRESPWIEGRSAPFVPSPPTSIPREDTTEDDTPIVKAF